MIAKMKKVIVIGPKSLTQPVLQALQDIGTVHLSESRSIQKMELDDPSIKNISLKEKKYAKIDTLLSSLPKTPFKPPVSEPLVDQDAWLDEISESCHNLNSKKQDLLDELSILKAYEGAITVLSPLLEPLQNSKNFEAIGFVLPRKEIRKLESTENEFLKLFNKEVLFFKKPIDAHSTGVVLAFPKSKSGTVRSTLNRLGLNELKIPSSLSSHPLKEAVEIMKTQLSEIPKKIQEIDQALAQLAHQHRNLLEYLAIQLENDISAIKTIKTTGQTKKTFVISGFNPAKDIPQLRNMIQERFHGIVHVEIQDCHDAPILYSNNRFVKPFELFIKILMPPKYGNIDPTPLFALFFPIFFGLIMGDIGYGLIMLTAGLILKFKGKTELLSNISKIILFCATYTILFGFVFGEFFGDWLEKKGIIHALRIHIGSIEVEWNRLHSLVPLLLLAVGIGIAHVMLGFLLKLFLSIKHRLTHEIIEVIAILLSLISLFVLLGVLAHQIPALAKTPSIVILLICVPLLIYLKGPMMLVELLSYVGNMLSYARLMAVGVASAYLAFVANMLGGLVGSFVFGILIAVLFHTINLALAFSPAIQSARLHYVEFFSKFLEQGGRLYKPFSKKRLK